MISLKDFMNLSVDEKKSFLDNLTDWEKDHVNTEWKKEWLIYQFQMFRLDNNE